MGHGKHGGSRGRSLLNSVSRLRWSLLVVGVAAVLCSHARLSAEAILADRAIQLPIEVVGGDGTFVEVPLAPMPAGPAKEIRGLRMRIHGLEYAGMASVKLNQADWAAISCTSVEVCEPGKSYGGIGGGFSTLDLILPLPAGVDLSTPGRLGFRFNHTDGNSSGFRVLSFEYVTNDGRRIAPSDHFAHEDPNAWRPPSDKAEDLVAGKRLWYSAPLVASGLKGAGPIHAHCADCHAQDGRDLKYFNFSNQSIIARSVFHGLSADQGTQIASYIRSLPFPNPGRPWNPPYQPGPGLSRKPVEAWSAGAGLEHADANDNDTIRELFGDGVAGSQKLRPGALAPDGQFDAHDVPIGFQLPDWNHWLPRVHPTDAWGAAANPMIQMQQAMQERLTSASNEQFIASGEIIHSFQSWVATRDAFLKSRTPSTANGWTSELTNKVYATQLWQLVKTWELEQEFALESRSRLVRGGAGPDRVWLNMIPSATAPAEVGIPNSPAGMNGNALANEYFNNAWYELQLQVDGSDHGRDASLRADWVYVIRHHLDLQHLSGRAEPGRVLLAIARAMQSTDPRLGPDNANGWRPNRNVDPRIMVEAEWAATFAPLSPSARHDLTEAFLSDWYEKTQRYPVSSYFNRFFNARDYSAPADMGKVSGGGVWQDAPLFASAGVRGSLLHRLRNWGREYANAASRFRY